MYGNKFDFESWLLRVPFWWRYLTPKESNPLLWGKELPLISPKTNLAWVTGKNVNTLLIEIGTGGEVALLSLDINRNDYWVLDTTSEISTRLFVFEKHSIIPRDKSLTFLDYPKFNCWIKESCEQDFRFVSLLEMKTLSEMKGCRMIGAIVIV